MNFHDTSQPHKSIEKDKGIVKLLPGVALAATEGEILFIILML